MILDFKFQSHKATLSDYLNALTLCGWNLKSKIVNLKSKIILGLSLLF